MSTPVVLITGALTGIGRAAASAFAREGYRVVVSGRHEDVGQALTAELRGLGGEAEFIRADVRCEDNVRTWPIRLTLAASRTSLPTPATTGLADGLTSGSTSLASMARSGRMRRRRVWLISRCSATATTRIPRASATSLTSGSNGGDARGACRS